MQIDLFAGIVVVEARGAVEVGQDGAILARQSGVGLSRHIAMPRHHLGAAGSKSTGKPEGQQAEKIA